LDSQDDFLDGEEELEEEYNEIKANVYKDIQGTESLI
jgi:hypothetical protein